MTDCPADAKRSVQLEDAAATDEPVSVLNQLCWRTDQFTCLAIYEHKEWFTSTNRSLLTFPGIRDLRSAAEYLGFEQRTAQSFCGREIELARIRELFSAESKRKPIVLLTGAEMTGKSTILRQLQLRSHELLRHFKEDLSRLRELSKPAGHDRGRSLHNAIPKVAILGHLDCNLLDEESLAVPRSSSFDRSASWSPGAFVWQLANLCGADSDASFRGALQGCDFNFPRIGDRHDDVMADPTGKFVAWLEALEKAFATLPLPLCIAIDGVDRCEAKSPILNLLTNAAVLAVLKRGKVSLLLSARSTKLLPSAVLSQCSHIDLDEQQLEHGEDDAIELMEQRLVLDADFRARLCRPGASLHDVLSAAAWTGRVLKLWQRVRNAPGEPDPLAYLDEQPVKRKPQALRIGFLAFQMDTFQAAPAAADSKGNELHAFANNLRSFDWLTAEMLVSTAVEASKIATELLDCVAALPLPLPLLQACACVAHPNASAAELDKGFRLISPLLQLHPASCTIVEASDSVLHVSTCPATELLAMLCGSPNTKHRFAAAPLLHFRSSCVRDLVFPHNRSKSSHLRGFNLVVATILLLAKRARCSASATSAFEAELETWMKQPLPDDLPAAFTTDLPWQADPAALALLIVGDLIQRSWHATALTSSTEYVNLPRDVAHAFVTECRLQDATVCSLPMLHLLARQDSWLLATSLIHSLNRDLRDTREQTAMFYVRSSEMVRALAPEAPHYTRDAVLSFPLNELQLEKQDPLMKLCSQRDANVMAVFEMVRAGAKRTQKDISGWTCLHYAVDKGRDDLLPWLITHHEPVGNEALTVYGNINLADREGFTALHLACSKGDAKCARVLLERQADPNIADANGQLPLSLLWRNFSSETATARVDIARMLLSAGALACWRDCGLDPVEVALSHGSHCGLIAFALESVPELRTLPGRVTVAIFEYVGAETSNDSADTKSEGVAVELTQLRATMKATVTAKPVKSVEQRLDEALDAHRLAALVADFVDDSG